MNRKSVRIVAASLSVLTPLWGAGTAGAYLSPSNPAVLTADPAQIQYMDPSYLNDYVAPAAPGYVIGPGSIPDYLTSPNWAYSPPLRKFVDTLPGLGAANANNLGQYIPVAVPDITTYPGSDYYEIELRQFREQMHSDLPAAPNATTMRGYMQVNLGTDTSACTDPSLNIANPCDAADNTVSAQAEPHYLGPVIVAQKDRPVRVKFINTLPTGAGGNLFVPVDTSIMGAGPFEIDYDPVTKEAAALTTGDFTQNRADLHLHGGRTPWISDGTPHQWITPAGEVTDYPTGVSVENVPDMPNPGPGAQTYYWTNQQSARMLFYHDHAWGITRLNVYVGEAAGYLIRDTVEQALIAAGTIPSDEIPLVIQDKTYVDASTIAATDPTWAWGTQPWDGTPGAAMTPVEGDFWWPHVYMPAQNPFDFSGIAPMGRWAYGPYFWPATNNFFQPIPNPYYDAACDPNNPATPGSLGGFCQAPEIPSSPNPSWGAEAFMDTPTVNGTAYPVLNVDPKPYRFRVLNAAHDRFFNLQMYIADNTPPVPVNTPQTPPVCADFTAPGYGGFANTCASDTEVRMVPASPTAVSTAPPGGGGILAKPATWPEDGRAGGVPDWSWVGPSWIMIGTEGGFLPQPVVLPNQPVNWNADVTTFNAGNVNGGSLILGPAERADVIVDFSAYAGQTLILYNDAPAPWPALDPHYDYYTDAPDNRAMGGADTTAVGFGPNTRTIMQIKVAAGAGTAFNMAPLTEAFDPADGVSPGVFRDSQDPIIAAQGNLNPTADPALYEAFVFDGTDFSAYNDNYNTTFPAAYPNWGISRINDTAISFYNPTAAAVQTVTMQKKAIQDEQGETFDEFGRMRAGLGLTLSNPAAGQVNFILQSYSDPSTEILTEDGIQVWKITHNGVDTHPVHFHLFDVQVLNRVGWDGFMRLPDPTEIGWKDTVRISPLEDTIVALKPVTPQMPFGVPESVRPLNPATPMGDATALSAIDPATGQAWATPNLNRMFNLDWEYVWHCHILSHEENDMMRNISFEFAETLPGTVTNLTATPNGANQIDLTWTDPTPVADPATLGNHANEIKFRIERSTNSGAYTFLADALANATTYSDATALAGSTYRYRVFAVNAAGDSPLPLDLIGVFRNDTWILDLNGNGQTDPGIDFVTTFGSPGNVPIVGDWNGDGSTEIGAFRDGYWYLDLNGNGVWDGEPTDKIAGRFGSGTGIVPVTGDWNNDGITEIGVFRTATRLWLLDLNGNGIWDDGIDLRTSFGSSGDLPVVGNWDGVGGDKIGTYRQGRWLLDMDGNGVWNRNIDRVVNLGIPGDLPVVGDWDGNGADWLGYYRNGIWFLDTSENGIWDGPGVDTRLGTFGRATDIPITGKWGY
ncbi:MAG: multicopper oxidase domain-containing protein [Deltaproteobacteria bacterium]|nr:multicopper oxidase domain-containing protein [Deltaproteobacteria bacterium]